MNKYQINDLVEYDNGLGVKVGRVYKIVVGTKLVGKYSREIYGAQRLIVKGSPISYGILGTPERILEREIIKKI